MISYLSNGGFIGRAANYRNTESYLQYVGGLTSGSTGGTGTRAISLAGIAMQPNDMVIVAYERGGTINKTATTISGYTTIASLFADNATEDSNLIVAYKFMGTTPDAEIVIPRTGSTVDAEAVAIQVWRGINTDNPLDVTAVTNTQLTSGIPNPPAITPVTTGAIIVVAAGTAHSGGTDTFGATYLTNFLTVGGNDDNDVTVGMGWITWPGGTYDPAAWTFTQGDTTTYSSNSVTFALRPATANAKNSGIWDLPGILNPSLFNVVGQQEYLTAAGTFSFVVPANLYQISAAVVGGGGGGAGGSAGDGDGATGGAGGGLAYGSFAVIPGETLTVVVGAGGNGGGAGSDGGAGGASSISRGATVLLQGGGGQGGLDRDTATRSGGTSTGAARAGGGSGGNSSATTDTGGGGGGAGGYSGNGGNGGSSGAGTNGAGGGGGGGGATTSAQGYGGGGVGVAGVTTNGTGGAVNTVGTGGSGGANGTRPAGGLYGGGGGACDDDTDGSGGAGGRGAVRLVWGKDLTFPSAAPTGIVAVVALLGISFLPQIKQY